MKSIAEFQLIGRVGVVKKVGSTTHVTIASNYSYKDEGGEWRDDPHWNEIVVFSATTTRYIEKYIGKGDLVHARGRVRQNSYERDDGERVFTVDLIGNDFSRLAQAIVTVSTATPMRGTTPSGAGKGARLPVRMTPFPTDRLAGGEAPRLPSSLFGAS
jgi:single-stranded DNA-binding protein